MKTPHRFTVHSNIDDEDGDENHTAFGSAVAESSTLGDLINRHSSENEVVWMPCSDRLFQGVTTAMTLLIPMLSPTRSLQAISKLSFGVLTSEHVLTTSLEDFLLSHN